MDKSSLKYEVIPADTNETIHDDLDVAERVVALARDKCKVVAKQHPDCVVIGADTLTVSDAGVVFTKPKPGSDPLDSAMQLSGQTIEVYTGCCIYSPQNGYVQTVARTTVTYQQFTLDQLEILAQNDSPQMRSGALGVFVDAPGFTLIEKVKGSYTGMYGLPMEFVYEQLASAE